MADQEKGYNFTLSQTIPCYIVEAINPNDVWKSDNPYVNQAPFMAFQIALNIFASNIFYQILKPIHQPRLIAEVLAGFTLSLIVSLEKDLVKTLIPAQGILSIETFANMGIMFYVFLSGLEMNLDNVLKVRKKATSIAIAGFIIPMVIGACSFAVIQKLYEEPTTSYSNDDDKNIGQAYLLWSLALSVTGFPVLARILTDLKLLYTGLGKAALTAAMISETYGWMMFIILIPFANNDGRAFWSMSSTIMFILFCFFTLRPHIMRYIDQKIDQVTLDDSQLLFVLMGAFVCSFLTDVLGTHSIVGAFVYGLILPHGRFADMVIGRLDDFVSAAMSPHFFFRSGLTVNLFMVSHQKYWPLLALVILLLCIPKVVSTLIATFFFGVPTRDGFGIGLLLNSKGILALIILNIAWDRKILSAVAFSIMVCAVFVMTIMVPIFINGIYKPRKQYERYRLRTIEKLRIDAELRVLTCIHNIRQATSMVNILKTFNATRMSPLHVFGIHLVELTGRATALLATHMDQPSFVGAQKLTTSQVELECIGNTFNALVDACNAVRVEALNAVSTYETIHVDIYSLAEQKRTTLILIPFHKHASLEGGLETTNEAYRDINLNILQDAPCSVAIFVDRGLGSLSKTNLHIVMLFIGGPDDREALAIAWRMAGHLGNKLSMVRILLFGEAAELGHTLASESPWLSSMIIDDERQKLLDDEYIDLFRFKAVYNNDSITYLEEEVYSSKELTLLLHELDRDECDLYIVGQGRGRNSLVFSGYMEWCNNPELGVVGDMVVSNSLGSRSSLLVVQQFGSGGMVFQSQCRHPRESPTKSHGFETLVVNGV